MIDHYIFPRIVSISVPVVIYVPDAMARCAERMVDVIERTYRLENRLRELAETIDDFKIAMQEISEPDYDWFRQWDRWTGRTTRRVDNVYAVPARRLLGFSRVARRAWKRRRFVQGLAS